MSGPPGGVPPCRAEPLDLEAYVQRSNKSTPQDVAREILAQVPRSAMTLFRKKTDGTILKLDLEKLSKTAAVRLGDCGTFPRGRVVLTWKDGGTMDLGSHQCNHRMCPRCARRRGYRLAGDMAGALAMIEKWGWGNDRTRFATLTIENTDSADEGISRVMDAWHKTLATKTWGRLIAGGFRAVEVKPGKNGKWNVHLHAIIYIWTPSVPYKLIRDAWDRAAGGKYNQRFDALRNKSKPHEGESKAAAAARYLVKYLVKHEELKGTRRMPGGLPHLLGAIEGRRLFGAWGLGAAALRIERHERPHWTAAWDKHLTGYTRDGLVPLRAEAVFPWGTREQVEVPLPPLPAAFRREDVPEQAEPRQGKWSVRKVSVGNPMHQHPWRDIPSASVKTAGAMQTLLETWLNNPGSRGPLPFRWRSWYQDATREWTDDAAVIMGERVQTNLGAALWSRIQKPDDRFPSADHPEHVAQQMISSCAQAVRTARRYMFGACAEEVRTVYLARLPDHVRHLLEETCRDQTRAMWMYRGEQVETGSQSNPDSPPFCRPTQKSYSRRGGSPQNGLNEPASRHPDSSGELTDGPSWIRVPLPLGRWN
jgi:hypothetical protein